MEEEKKEEEVFCYKCMMIKKNKEADCLYKGKPFCY